MTSIKNAGARAVLLAAGQGKRMKSSKPKVLHEILGKSIISRVIDAIDELRLEHLYIIVGHGGEELNAYLQQNQPSTPWSVHFQQPQLGTGHALMQIADVLGSFTGTLLVTPADSPLISSQTLQSLISRQQKESSAMVVLTTMVEDPKNYGRIFRDTAGKVMQIVEDKDASDEQKAIREVNTAVYGLDWRQVSAGLGSLSNENQQGEYYLTDLAGWAVKKGLRVDAQIADDWREVIGINSRVELAEASRLLQKSVNRQLGLAGVTLMDPDSTWIAPEVSIGADTTILPGCLIYGDVSIGSSCEIGPQTMIYGRSRVGDRTVICQSRVSDTEIGSDTWVGPFAHLRDGVTLGDFARIGNFVEVKKSSIGNHSKASHLSYVGDCSVGEHSNLGAGTITANYDHISKKKQRTAIGNNVSTGCNSVLVAPLEVGDGANVAAGSVITKNVPPGALAVARARQENKDRWADNKRRQLNYT